MILLFKLLGINSRLITNAYWNENNVSAVQWSYFWIKEPQPTRRQYKHYKLYIEWLRKIDIVTDINFKAKVYW